MLQKNIVYVSDTHFGHENIIKYCDRPWTHVNKMDNDLFASLMAFDRSDTSIVHMGDFAFKMPQYKFSHPENHILIMGNHDKGDASKYVDWFGTVVGTPKTWRNHVHIIEDNGKKIMLSHAPQDNLNGCDFNIYGHTHNSVFKQPEYHFKEYPFLKNSEQHLCACVELVEYKPQSLDTVVSFNRKILFETRNATI